VGNLLSVIIITGLSGVMEWYIDKILG